MRSAGLSLIFWRHSWRRLVLAGELDTILPPRFGHAAAQAIPNARFEVMPGEAHQPFQEVPDQFIARVDAFWRDADRRG